MKTGIGFVVAMLLGLSNAQGEVASHYGRGDGYWGRKTATGAIHRPGDLTTAHKSLPFGTKVRLTNTANGKTVVVTVNNRGPFIKGRTWDVNSTVADLLGMGGLGKVTSEVIKP
jgi:rare lipoprotein A